MNHYVKLLAAIGVGAAVMAACPSPAHADPVVNDFVATNGWRVCVDLDAAPNFQGIRTIQSNLAERGYNQQQRGEIILMSVLDQCQRHVPLLKAYVDSKTPQQQGRAA